MGRARERKEPRTEVRGSFERAVADARPPGYFLFRSVSYSTIFASFK